MRVIVIGDIHYTTETPARRKDRYGDQVLEKLMHCRLYAEKLGVDAVLLTGDLFHRKRPTLVEIEDLAGSLSMFPCPVYAIAGNHDVSQTGSGFGILAASEVIEVLDADGITLAGVSIIGHSHEMGYEEQHPYTDFLAGPRITLTHGMLLRESLPADVPYTLIQEVAKELPENVLVFNGHVHAPDEEGNVYNVGSLGRVAINEQHNPRIIFAQYVEEWTVKSIDVPCEDDVWTDEDVRPVAMGDDSVRSFVELLQVTDNVEARSEALLEQLLKDRDDRVKTAVKELLA